MPGTSLGLGYRSAIHHRIEGEQTFDATVRNPVTGAVLIPSGAAFAVQAGVTLPQMVTFSARQQITDRMSVSGTVEWVNWGRLGVVPIAGSPVGTELVLNYRDGWYASIGADYAFGHETLGGFQKAFEDCGGQIVQKIWPPIGTKDFGPYIPTIRADIDAIVALMVEIRMSRCCTWASSCAITPRSSRGVSRRRIPVVAATAACSGLRPVAKAFGCGSGET